MKRIKTITTAALALCIGGFPALADCEGDITQMTVVMNTVELYSTQFSGLMAQGRAAAEAKDLTQLKSIDGRMRANAYETINVSTQALEIIDRLDADPDNCNITQANLDEVRNSLQENLDAAKVVVKSITP
jgi:hypothetical protein